MLPISFRPALVALVTLSLVAAFGPASQAKPSPLVVKLDAAKTARVKLSDTFRAAKLTPGPVPAALKSVASNANDLALRAATLRTEAASVGAKDDVLLKIGDIKDECTRMAQQITGLLKNQQITYEEIQAMTGMLTRIEDQFAAVLGLVEPVITR